MDTAADSQFPTPRAIAVDQQAARDERDLAAMGHTQALHRKFSMGSMFFLAFIVLGTWSTFAQGLNSGLVSGGPITILWGLVFVTFCNLCVAVSLGELCSSMPTAMGQAYWISRLWPGDWGRFVSYMCAWINTFGWWTLSASQLAFMADFILSMKILYAPNWSHASDGWINFLVYLGLTFLLTVANIVSCKRDPILPWVNNFVGVCFIGLFVIFSVVLLACVGGKADLSFQPASFVFGTWINQGGWNDGVTWFLGLVQAAYGLTAFDAAIHLVEEIPQPRKTIPRVLWLSVTMGAITGFIFMVVCLFCIQDLDAVLNPATGLPFIELLLQATGLKGGTVLLAFFIFNGIGQAISILTTGSRLTWGFARDGGLPWSTCLSRVSVYWNAPSRALWLQGIVIGLVGVLYTFADTVLEAILSVTTIALTVSYGMPIMVLLLVGRDKIPPGGVYSLGKLGPTINWIAVIYCIVTTVFFLFPESPNPTGSSMNYAVVVFGIMLVVSIGFWFIKGHRTYLRFVAVEQASITAQSMDDPVVHEDSQGGKKS
ncbi:choline transport protein [Emericellopsis cladophorae]|uniref:Choline transport protein n=1 Tax=Emericellopsis cladophorae TaxID=2686198 RepID=A0A9P9XX47_9HYPO|nr:choline transport protein [Emericellopsis cladophorae]KAI6779258.1 choline transport protein [Emericellopsis cladophorae]